MVLRVTVGVPIAPGEPLLADTVLGVPYFAQQQTNWCWAACAEMILHFFGITYTRQCDIASTEFSADCCANAGSTVCNQGGWPDRPLRRGGIQCSGTNAALGTNAIRGELNSNQPLIVYYAWSGGGAHVAVMRGCYANDDLDINDPWYGTGRRTYNYVLSAYGLGQWNYTYYGIRR